MNRDWSQTFNDRTSPARLLACVKGCLRASVRALSVLALTLSLSTPAFAESTATPVDRTSSERLSGRLPKRLSKTATPGRLALTPANKPIRLAQVAPTPSTATYGQPLRTRVAQNSTPAAARLQAPTVSKNPSVATTVEPVPRLQSKKADPRFNLLLDLSTSSSLQKTGDVSRVAETSLGLAPKVLLGHDISLSALAVVTQEQSGEQNTTLSNLNLALDHTALPLSENFSLTPILFAKTPTDTVDNKQDSFKGSGGLSLKLGLDPKWAWKAKFAYGITGEKNVHEFTLNADGDPNIEYVVSNQIVMSLPVTETVAVSASVAYVSAWTYHDFQRQRFDLAQIAAWEVVKNWSLYVGHSNKGSALKANGRDSNMRVFNENTSVFSLGTSYLF